MKKRLRQQMIHLLTTMNKEERQVIEQHILEQLFNFPIWHEKHMIGITMSHRFEWDTKKVIQFFWKHGKQIVIPKTDERRKQLQFYKIDDFSDLELGYGNILEPKPDESKQVSKSEIDLLIVPGIVFNEEGFRIGFGGGYYDRFLATFPNTTLALLSEKQLDKLIPVQTHDIAVHYLITEKRVIHT